LLILPAFSPATLLVSHDDGIYQGIHGTIALPGFIVKPLVILCGNRKRRLVIGRPNRLLPQSDHLDIFEVNPFKRLQQPPG